MFKLLHVDIAPGGICPTVAVGENSNMTASLYASDAFVIRAGERRKVSTGLTFGREGVVLLYDITPNVYVEKDLFVKGEPVYVTIVNTGTKDHTVELNDKYAELLFQEE